MFLVGNISWNTVGLISQENPLLEHHSKLMVLDVTPAICQNMEKPLELFLCQRNIDNVTLACSTSFGTLLHQVFHSIPLPQLSASAFS